MKTISISRHIFARAGRTATVVTAPFALLLSASPAVATPVPKNLGNGLRDIVPQQQQQQPQASTQTATPASAQTAVFASNNNIISDDKGRVLVKVVLNGEAPITDVQSNIVALGGTVTVTNTRYRAGVIEALISPSAAPELARTHGVLSVNLSLRPHHNIGKATTQGIVQHRIDKLPAGINGAGMTVGVLSDSFNTAGGPIKAGDDVASGDLPGPANPFGHTDPVVVFQDDQFGNDEGRAMLQIVHDIAPNARLGFGTADFGEVGFADNIRSLAGLPSGSLSKPNFKADVVIDDVIYFDEPMFQDGIVAQAVDDVAGAGVSYFSSAGNNPASQAYDAPFRPVPNTAGATAGTNINFKNVDPSLYKGGFHNFATGPGQDIAQTIHLNGGGTISFQWSEPYDSTPPKLGKVLQSGSGTLTKAMPTKSFPFAGTAGERIGIFADAAPGNNPLPDVTIELLDPQGKEVAFQDNTTDPELLVSFLPVTGAYTIVIGGYQNATGDFIYQVRQAAGTEQVETDFNLLFFDTNGKFLLAFAEDNLATGQPIEIGTINGASDVQMVIARGNKPARGAMTATRLRYVWFGSPTLGEYIDYSAAGTFGHCCALGANGVAAYPFYPPFIPESFTSPGPVSIYFDANNNPLAQPDFRRKPDMAAMDGANTTFFVSDASQDPDTLPNFFGTSAAAPHAGGIAALVLQAAGGPHSLSPKALSQILQTSTFTHDLDSNHSSAILQKGAQKVVVTAEGDGTNTSSMDPNFFGVTYTGGASLTSLAINLSNANPTETVPGLVFDPTTTTGFPFTLGNLFHISPNAISTNFDFPAKPPGSSSQYRRLTISFDNGAMTSGDMIHFGVDRDEADAFGPNGAVGGNSADLLGSGVLIPQGTVVQGAATVTAILSNGTTLQGVFTNNLGHGWAPLDGYGFINAQAAVQAVQH